MASVELVTPTDYIIAGIKILLALSPLFVLAYILYSAFESPELEAQKRRKKGFELEGHAE